MEAATDPEFVQLRFDIMATVATAGEWGDEVLVPVIGTGIGTGTATVLDRRRLREVRVRCETVRLVAGRVCVVARSHGVEDGLHRVTLPGGWRRGCGSSRRSWGGR